uniref:Sodium/calcium exchanger membrane region domain-containing protein n=1 Tax=Amphiprion ocellaris TaxID=80972 RepID=A0AAQ5XZC2_AMPOC
RCALWAKLLVSTHEFSGDLSSEGRPLCWVSENFFYVLCVKCCNSRFLSLAALHEFPTDLFTHKERTEGAVALHVLCTIYMFCALALVCDDYFVPSLEKICERLNLSEDVAGATFMAAGSSAPELFTSVIGVFITKGDVGVGTIVGSAVFNILCIIGVCGFFAGQAVKLSHWALLRDSIFYTFSIIALIAFILCYFFAANFHCKPSVLMVDELLSAYPHQLSFSEAGMRIMITSHFSPRTRLTMASRMLINEVRTRSLTQVTAKSLNGRCRLQRLESGNETENENEDNENNENDEEGEGEDDNEGPLVPFKVPAGVCNKLKWLTMWPLSLLLFFTVPNCAKRRWERWFMVSFFTATIWIAGLSYIMVWMVTVIGFTLGIPDVIMGITFLAAGTSVPDCMASVIVARQGMGDMAISNSIGSNVFDILVGLGLPWALQTLCIDYGSNIHLNSRGLIFSVGLLLASVFFTVLGVHLNKWTLDRRLGLACLVMYAIFLCFSILIEFNVFIFVNLPMCRDIH